MEFRTINGQKFEVINVELPQSDIKKINLGKSANGLTYQVTLDIGIVDEATLGALPTIRRSKNFCKVTVEGLKELPPEQIELRFIDNSTGEILDDGY